MTDSAVPIAAGRPIHRPLARGLHHLGVPLYGKLEILAFQDSTVTFRCWSTRTAGTRTSCPACRTTDRRDRPQAPAPGPRGEPRLAAAPPRPVGRAAARRASSSSTASAASCWCRRRARKAERNAASEEVARRKRAKEPADELMARLKASGDEVKALDARLREVETALDQRALAVPNFPSDADARRRRERQPRGAHLGRAAGVRLHPSTALGAGRRSRAFSICRPAPRSPARASRCCAGSGARLVRALSGFMLDLHTREHGYEEIAPPYLVNRATADGHGAAPQVRGRPLRRAVGRSVPHSDRRGAGHQHSSGRDPRCRGPAARPTARTRRASAARPGRTARTPAD